MALIDELETLARLMRQLPEVEEEAERCQEAAKNALDNVAYVKEGIDEIRLRVCNLLMPPNIVVDGPHAPAQPLDELRSVPGAEEEGRDQSEGVRRFTEEVIRSETRDPGEVPAPEDAAEDFTLLDPALLNIDEPVLEATILPQVTPDEVPPTAEVIHTDDERKRFALFGGQTHEVVSGSGNPDADLWASVLHPKPKVDA